MPLSGSEWRYSKSRSRERMRLAKKETLQVGIPLQLTSEAKNEGPEIRQEQ